MAIKLPNLPYDSDALEPHVSAETLSFHYGKHHKGYVDKLNAAIEDTSLDSMALDQVIAEARGKDDQGLLNNALQSWNHGFLWESMTPNGPEKPEGRIKEMVESGFGDVDRFKKRFKEAALAQFGSGWAWLVEDMGELRVITTSDAESPVGTHQTPLLTLDVWEHAYYLDYQNERNRYVDAFLENLINWKFVAANLEKSDQVKAA